MHRFIPKTLEFANISLFTLVEFWKTNIQSERISNHNLPLPNTAEDFLLNNTGNFWNGAFNSFLLRHIGLKGFDGLTERKRNTCATVFSILAVLGAETFIPIGVSDLKDIPMGVAGALVQYVVADQVIKAEEQSHIPDSILEKIK